jgi:hypothetical protein
MKPRRRSSPKKANVSGRIARRNIAGFRNGLRDLGFIEGRNRERRRFERQSCDRPSNQCCPRARIDLNRRVAVAAESGDNNAISGRPEGCSARIASGHAAAAPQSNVMNSRRLIGPPSNGGPQPITFSKRERCALQQSLPEIGSSIATGRDKLQVRPCLQCPVSDGRPEKGGLSLGPIGDIPTERGVVWAANIFQQKPRANGLT